MNRPKPTALLKFRKGKLYGDQAAREENEPKAKREIIPQCPEVLREDERQEWNYFALILDNYGLLTIANAPMLELLAANMAQYKECMKSIRQDGIIIKDKLGRANQSIYWRTANKLEEKILKILTELGLSSVALCRIGGFVAKKKKEKNEFFAD